MFNVSHIIFFTIYRKLIRTTVAQTKISVRGNNKMIITGTDLRIMRLRAGKTTVQMAEFASVKTRKTYENWEKNVGSPSMNQFLAMSMSCGFNPSELIKMYVDRDSNESEIDLMAASNA